jgi:hypothetical protein
VGTICVILKARGVNRLLEAPCGVRCALAKSVVIAVLNGAVGRCHALYRFSDLDFTKPTSYHGEK